jgi:hypothetical protein
VEDLKQICHREFSLACGNDKYLFQSLYFNKPIKRVWWSDKQICFTLRLHNALMTHIPNLVYNLHQNLRQRQRPSFTANKDESC